MPNSTERWPDRQYTQGVGATRAWDVVVAKDEEEAIRMVANEHSQGSGTSHPLDAGLIGSNPQVAMVGPAPLWIVTLPYQPLSTVAVKNPLSLPPKILWEPGEQCEPIDRDAFNNPILNSAGDRPATNLTETFPLLFLTVTRWESSYDVRKHFAYRNRVNSDRFVIFGKWIVEAGQCLCHGYFPTGEFSLDATYVQVAYKFEFQAGETQDGDNLYDGFKRRFLDAGRTGWFKDEDDDDKIKKGRITTIDSNGQNIQVTTDVPLNGLGVSIDANLKVEGEDAVKNPNALPAQVYKDSFDKATYLKYLTKQKIKMSAIFN